MKCTVFFGGGGRHGLLQLTTSDNWKPKVVEAIRIAIVNLEAIPAPAGQFDVVLGPGWPGILLHEAIGHGLEGPTRTRGSRLPAEYSCQGAWVQLRGQARTGFVSTPL